MPHKQKRTTHVGKSPVSVGRFTYGHENINIRQWGEGAALSIGAFCSIGASVKIFLGGNHRSDWISTFPFGHIYQQDLGGENIIGHPSSKGPVEIGNDVWIGEGVTIMSGIKIGNGVIIAANSTVTKDVDHYLIVGGNPAKVIKKRFEEKYAELLLKFAWWDLPLEEIKILVPILSGRPSISILESLLKKYR
ncbi:CatB-related O-acetyltransferase [Polynucleobacter sp. CS-Odin-A6]|uniref:CatB-related O-acetyltransferase n=1 Tax=Polynucleobacter sp. CS-Odin-A6 TaxID=2689106 RepID=UPI001C0E6E72|nr:CatB-related O-acetyltransferase [Polynucleobacter sp. CS-Odin-A6]MBU3621317.1 CatB-related O-acetyltransferase [Polynucleobacter sp. CS-Odin-A6]